MSISDFAEACNVVNSTIFRFCRTLDLLGYQDFKLTLAQSLPQQETTQLRASGYINRDDTPYEVCQKVLSAMTNALNDTCRILDIDRINQAVSYMIGARCIYFLGVGSSGISAAEAQNKFLRIRPNVMFLSDTHLQTIAASLMDENDVAVAFSYSGIAQDTIEATALAKESGAKIICITRFPKSPVTQYADVIIRCGANESPLQGGSISASITQQYILEVLYEEYFRQTYDVSTDNKKKTAKSIVKKLL